MECPKCGGRIPVGVAGKLIKVECGHCGHSWSPSHVTVEEKLNQREDEANARLRIDPNDQQAKEDIGTIRRARRAIA